MSQVDLNKILVAIKTNDLVLFSSCIKGNKGLSFGRFPVLSLCYLYKANKIIKKYKNELIKVTKYIFVDEPYEIYKNFREVAGRCLRLYVKQDNLVSPIEMMAIMHKDSDVKKYFNLFVRENKIVRNLQTIYTIYVQKFEVKTNKVFISRPPLNAYQKRVCKLSLITSLCFVCLVSILSLIVGLTTGLGTSFSPFKIHDVSAFYSALSSTSGNYVLTKNLSLNSLPTSLDFGGEFDGNNKTIFVKSNLKDNLIEVNNGTIKNINIVYLDSTLTITKSLSLFVGTNNGYIENVNITCANLNLNCKKSNKDIFVNGYANTNNGVINNCKITLNALVSTEGNGECFINGFVGTNTNTIKNCEFLNAEINTTECDVSGFATFNNKNAKILNCKNYAKLTQTNQVDEWSPNVAGMVLTNYGLIKNSINYAQIKAVSNNNLQDAKGSVFAAGIVTMNYGNIIKCLNKGQISASSEMLIVYAGGISAYSTYFIGENYNLIPEIKNCVSDANINVATEGEKAFVFAGGISGYLYGKIHNCFSLSTFTNGNNDSKYFVGLCVGSLYAQNYTIEGIIIPGRYIIVLDAKNVYMLNQNNVASQVGSLINANIYGERIIVSKSVDVSDLFENFSTCETIEYIEQQEGYWNE